MILKVSHACIKCNVSLNTCWKYPLFYNHSGREIHIFPEKYTGVYWFSTYPFEQLTTNCHYVKCEGDIGKWWPQTGTLALNFSMERTHWCHIFLNSHLFWKREGRSCREWYRAPLYMLRVKSRQVNKDCLFPRSRDKPKNWTAINPKIEPR